MPKKNAKIQRKRDIAVILYYLDTIQRRIQRQHLTANQSSTNRVGSDYQDLTIVQVQILKSVMAHQPVSIKRLAELRDITSSAATQAVDSLANKGFVNREQDESDRRSTLISLTPNFQERVSEFMQNLGNSFDTVFDMLSDKELTDFAHLCGKIVDDSESN